MSNHYEWGIARDGLYGIVTKESAPEEWNLPEPDPLDVFSVGVTAPYALGVFNANGDGTILEGDAGEILDYVDKLHAYTHRELDGTVQSERVCANCGDQGLTLSSRDWCDGCEAVTIPGEVWTAFLEQESQLDQEHPGDVSLSAVVGELMRLLAEHQQSYPLAGPRVPRGQNVARHPGVGGPAPKPPAFGHNPPPHPAPGWGGGCDSVGRVRVVAVGALLLLLFLYVCRRRTPHLVSVLSAGCSLIQASRA